MKKILFLLVAFMATVSANAQFEEGKTYVGASLTGLDLSYSKGEKMSVGLNAMGGYFLMDNIMVNGNIGLQTNEGARANEFTIGAGGRYYFVENGIFVGANVNFAHVQHTYTDVVPQVEAGYAFFINRSVTIEPAVYFRPSFSNSDRTRFGIKVGIGLNLETNKKNGTIFNMD